MFSLQVHLISAVPFEFDWQGHDLEKIGDLFITRVTAHVRNWSEALIGTHPRGEITRNMISAFSISIITSSYQCFIQNSIC